jgi:hypothetical protein
LLRWGRKNITLGDNFFKKECQLLQSGIIFVVTPRYMSTNKKYIPDDNDCITSKDRSVIDYWCERLSISPFTLFHVMRTVGNNITKIEEFLYNQSPAVYNETKNSQQLEVHK